MTVVLADGSVAKLGRTTAKGVTGYDLAGLFVGSEGMLGVITEVTVRLRGIPERVVAVRAAFPDLDAAAECATALVGAGSALTRVELIDAETAAAINAYKGTALTVRPHLFIEFGGSPSTVEGELRAMREIAADCGCEAIEEARGHEERARLWEARHEVLFAVEHANPGLTCKGTDTCVPISELPGAVRFARRTMEAAGFPASIIGHVGDGNYHAMFMVDTDDPAQLARMKEVDAAIVADALARAGTCSGEIGIGIGKIPYLEQEHPDLIPLMRDVKSLLDPGWVLNPGKVFTAQ
jgi:D-lactate dehydrogenase (cytochrome)